MLVGVVGIDPTNLATVAVDEKRVVVAVQDDSKSGGHGFGSNVDLAVLVGGNVDLVMANVIFLHEGDVLF